MEDKSKALVALAVPLAGIISKFIATGEINEEELKAAILAVVTAILVFYVPNTPKKPRMSSKYKPHQWEE